jgi:MFS family permease
MQETLVLYVAFNATYAVLAYPFGHLADRYGARRVLMASFAVFAAVYAGFGWASPIHLWWLFPSYGLYMAMSESVGKAYVSSLVPAEMCGTALGLYYTVTGLTAFFASLVAGFLWEYVSVQSPFYLGSMLAIVSGFWFWWSGREKSFA